MVLAAGVLGISCAALWKNRHSRGEDTAASPASTMIIVATFICIFHNVYDLPLLIVPLAAGATAAGSGWRSLGAARRYGIAALLVVPFVNIFWTQGFRTLVGQLGVRRGRGRGPAVRGCLPTGMLRERPGAAGRVGPAGAQRVFPQKFHRRRREHDRGGRQSYSQRRCSAERVIQ